jgi:hypothetical protein
MDGRALFNFGSTCKQNRVPGAAPWPTTRMAQTYSILHQSLSHFFLHDPGDERDPFCPLTVVEMVSGELATTRRFERPLLMTAVASSGAMAPRMTPEVAVGVGDHPPCGGLGRESLE